MNYPKENLEPWHNVFLTGTSSLYQQGQGSAAIAKMALKVILPSCWRKLHFQPIESPAFTNISNRFSSNFYWQAVHHILVMYPSPSYPPVFDDLLFSKAFQYNTPRWQKICVLSIQEKMHPEQSCTSVFECSGLQNLDRHSKISPQGGAEHFHITNSRMA